LGGGVLKIKTFLCSCHLGPKKRFLGPPPPPKMNRDMDCPPSTFCTVSVNTMGEGVVGEEGGERVAGEREGGHRIYTVRVQLVC
jgi:hypothetical protein